MEGCTLPAVSRPHTLSHHTYKDIRRKTPKANGEFMRNAGNGYWPACFRFRISPFNFNKDRTGRPVYSMGRPSTRTAL